MWNQTLARLHRLWAALLPALALALIWAAPAAAQDGPARTTASDPAWRAAYWNNTDLVGAPVLERDDAELNFDWGGGSPDPAVHPDLFSARWTRYLYLEEGLYRFTASADDGVRVFVDDRVIIDDWRDGPVRDSVGERALTTGHHLVRVEYYEKSDLAVAKLRWERIAGPTPTAPPPPPAPTPSPETWRGEYFSNRDLSGDPTLVRADSRIDFNWGTGAPAAGLPADNFSVRWTRSPEFKAGMRRFTVTSDDGVRLWVNDRLIIDRWQVQAPTTFAADIYLPAGRIPIRLEYFEGAEQARISLTWTGDDGDSGQTPPSNRWRAQYFAGRDLRGAPLLVRDENAIAWNWELGSPEQGVVPADNFSARWTRTMRLAGGRYRFTVETDDGVRLYVDDKLIVDRWQVQTRTRYAVTLDLTSGNHTVRMEYFEATEQAYARLTWSRLRQDEQPVGNIVTCVPPQPANNAWIRLYRLNSANQWVSLGRGIGSIDPTGYLKIDGLPVDERRFGKEGEPYRVEQLVDDVVLESTGNFQTGEPTFRVRANMDNPTPWQCR